MSACASRHPLSSPVGIILGFYIAYAFACAVTVALVHLPPLGWWPVVVSLTYVTSLATGAYIGGVARFSKIRSLQIASPMLILGTTALIAAVGTGVLWYRLIGEFGVLTLITSPNAIRYDIIDQDTGLFPRYASYSASLAYAGFAFSLSGMVHERRSSQLAWAALFFVMIVSTNLLTFSRAGIVFALFVFAGFLIILQERTRLNLRHLLVVLVIGMIVLIPRIIRREGAGFWEVDAYAPEYLVYSMSGPVREVVDALVSYTGGLFALGEFLNTHDGQYTYGERTFTPLLRIVGFLYQGSHISTVDPNVQSFLFDFNVYTVIRDFYGDFGVAGLVLLPLVIGFLFGAIFARRGRVADAIKMLMLAWLFYTPVYNAFSFGGYLLSLVYLLGLALLVDSASSRFRKRRGTIPMRTSVPS